MRDQQLNVTRIACWTEDAFREVYTVYLTPLGVSLKCRVAEYNLPTLYDTV